MSSYRFYRFFSDAGFKESLKRDNVKIPKGNYRALYDHIFKCLKHNSHSLGKKVGDMTCFMEIMAERYSLVVQRHSTIIVEDMDTVERIKGFKVTVQDVSKLLDVGEVLTIAVPYDSDLEPILVGRYPPGYFLQVPNEPPTEVKSCGHAHLFFCSNHMDYGGYNSVSDHCYKDLDLTEYSPSVQFAIKLLMYRNACREKFKQTLPSTLSKVTSLRESKSVERIALKKLNTSESFSIHEHYRRDHVRQLWADRYYQGSDAGRERGSRTCFVEACLVHRKSKEIITV